MDPLEEPVPSGEQDEGQDMGIEVEELEYGGFHLSLEEAISAMAVSPGDLTLAVGTLDDEICVVDTGKGEIAYKLDGHAGGVNSLSYLTEKLLASAGEDGTAAVWDVTTGSLVSRVEVDGVDADRTPDGHTVKNVAVMANRKAFAVSAGRSVTIISVEDAELDESKIKVFPPVASSVEDLKFLPSGELLAGYYGGVSIWSPEVGEQGIELPFTGNFLSVSASEDRRWIIGGCHDATVHIWQLLESGQVQELSCGGYEGKVTNCAFDPTYRWLASTGGNRNVIWDFSGAGPAGSMPTIAVGHSMALTSQAWHPVEKGILLTGGKDGQLIVFDVANAKVDHYGSSQARICFPSKMASHVQDHVTEVAWGTEGRIYSGHMSGEVRTWKCSSV